MTISTEFLIIIIIFLIYLDILMIAILILKRVNNKIIKNDDKEIRKKFTKAILNKEPIKKSIDIKSYLKFNNIVKLDDNTKRYIKENLNVSKNIKKYKNNINSIFKIKRIEVSVYLSLIENNDSRIILEKRLLKEKDMCVKLYIANSLSDIGSELSIPILVESLLDSNKWYCDKANILISNYGEKFNKYLDNIVNDKRYEIKNLIVDFSYNYVSREVKTYLINLISNQDFFKEENDKELNNILYKAVNSIAKYYPKILDDKKYIYSNNIVVRNISIKSLANYKTVKNIDRLVSMLDNKDIMNSLIYSLSEIIKFNPEYIKYLISKFEKETNLIIKNRISEILSNRIEYLIMKTKSNDNIIYLNIIKELIKIGKTSDFIVFINKNRDLDLEDVLIKLLKEVLNEKPYLEKEFCLHLKKEIVQKCGLESCERHLKSNKRTSNNNNSHYLVYTMIIFIMIFPIIYFIRHFNIIYILPLFKQIQIFILDFNYYLAFYSICINMIYMVLLIFSFINVSRQKKLWKLKKYSILSKRNMIPSISVLAPAYNESKTIIESSKSLLNLNYPDYELIIINDGSTDNTMDVLIEKYNLVKVDFTFNSSILTKTIIGIYKNKNIPNLIVIDKENGGKADSLNVGINVSSKDYVCGIDADSFIENDSLLKLSSITLDYCEEITALGGNIIPANGCNIDEGFLSDINIPKNILAKFQAIEYSRAFQSSRLGWAYLNCLLIISGAFGLFKKNRIINVGGYLTSSGKYKKDTVGEDMELVVRINKYMRDKKLKYKIDFMYNANCWTEVPEDIKSLKNQRYRWHRGLIDIITFHKNMLFNIKYGRIGLISMPYFLIFEVIGPLIEIQGYIMVFLALVFSLLNLKIALLLFISTILMGTLISVASLLIGDTNMKKFKFKDILILIVYSVLENFGPRQIMSFWRFGGYLSVIKKVEGWGEIKRKGFESK